MPGHPGIVKNPLLAAPPSKCPATSLSPVNMPDREYGNLFAIPQNSPLDNRLYRR